MANLKIKLDAEINDKQKAFQLTNEIMYHNQEASRATHELVELISLKGKVSKEIYMKDKMNDLLSSDINKLKIGLIDEFGNKQKPIAVIDNNDVHLKGHVYIQCDYKNSAEEKDIIIERQNFKDK